jgi:hypothetical protein
LIHKVHGIDRNEVRNLLHQIHDKGEGQALTLHDLLHIHCANVLQFLESLILRIVKLKIYILLALLAFDLDVR